jgi:hypothetical protein
MMITTWQKIERMNKCLRKGGESAGLLKQEMLLFKGKLNL